MKTLKHLSDGLAVLAIIVLVIAIATSNAILYGVAGFLFLDAVVVTSLRRRQAKARRTTAS